MPWTARWGGMRSVRLLSRGSLGGEQRDSRQQTQTEGGEKGKPAVRGGDASAGVVDGAG